MEWNPDAPFEGAPARWRKAVSIRAGVVPFQGKYYWPLREGHVLELDGGTVQEYKTSLSGITGWQICTSTPAPVGYGHSGVFALDEHLCPVARIIDTRAEGRFSPARPVILLASDGSTICLLTIKERRWLLQIWSIDGKEKLREQVVVRPGQVEGDRGRLIPLHKGYLFSGGELTWLSRSAEVPPWRFGPGAEPGRAVPRPSDHVRPRYGVPVITNGLLFVACRDGGIYVFDALAITAPSRPVADTRVPSVHDG